MSSPQPRRELPREIRDEILGCLLVDEVVEVRTVETRACLTAEEIEARIRASGHSDAMLESLRRRGGFSASLYDQLSQADLLYSDSLWILIGEGVMQDEIQHSVHKNATLDLTRINLRRVTHCQEILGPLLHKFRKIQVSFDFPNKELGILFDQIEHLTIKGPHWQSSRNVMDPQTRSMEDNLSVIHARAIKGLFRLTKGATVELVKVRDGCEPDHLANLPIRILQDERRDQDAASYGKKHGTCHIE
jgi:hypothetical protein